MERDRAHRAACGEQHGAEAVARLGAGWVKATREAKVPPCSTLLALHRHHRRHAMVKLVVSWRGPEAELKVLTRRVEVSSAAVLDGTLAGAARDLRGAFGEDKDHQHPSLAARNRVARVPRSARMNHRVAWSVL